MLLLAIKFLPFFTFYDVRSVVRIFVRSVVRIFVRSVVRIFTRTVVRKVVI